MRILKSHNTHVALFLSKDVTHVIGLKKTIDTSKYSVSKQRYGRPEKIVQLARKSLLEKSKGSLLEHPYKVLNTNTVIKHSIQC